MITAMVLATIMILFPDRYFVKVEDQLSWRVFMVQLIVPYIMFFLWSILFPTWDSCTMTPWYRAYLLSIIAISIIYCIEWCRNSGATNNPQ